MNASDLKLPGKTHTLKKRNMQMYRNSRRRQAMPITKLLASDYKAIA